uniref:Uncharacterized protein n=1 Tax=Picea sitchensis TaxID=3332 RepID=A0A6B9XUL4_PICSI|nr:hypothetical protein Q903MT_gene3814 [Picea sitchensis]
MQLRGPLVTLDLTGVGIMPSAKEPYVNHSHRAVRDILHCTFDPKRNIFMTEMTSIV